MSCSSPWNRPHSSLESLPPPPSGGNDERRTQNAKVQAETSVPLSRGPVVFSALLSSPLAKACLRCAPALRSTFYVLRSAFRLSSHRRTWRIRREPVSTCSAPEEWVASPRAAAWWSPQNVKRQGLTPMARVTPTFRSAAWAVLDSALFLGTYPGLTPSQLDYEIETIRRFTAEFKSKV